MIQKNKQIPHYNSSQFYGLETITSELLNNSNTSYLRADEQASIKFLQKILPVWCGNANKKSLCAEHRILDVAAGVGRITQNILFPFLKQISYDNSTANNKYTIDLLDSERFFLEQAQKNIAQKNNVLENVVIENFFCSKVQDFHRASRIHYKYSLIWIDWLFCLLLNKEAEQFLHNIKSELLKSHQDLDTKSFVIIKDNLSTEKYKLDCKQYGENSVFTDPRTGHSLCERTDDDYKELFSRAGFSLFCEQEENISGFFARKMYAICQGH